MPVLRFLITSLAVVFGLIGAALLMTVGFVVFVFSWLFGRRAPMPRFQASFHRQVPRPAPAPRDDVIDVVATEVKDGSARPQPRLDG